MGHGEGPSVKFVMLPFWVINCIDEYGRLWHILKTNVFDGMHQVL
jgi:hypothetical protein